MLFIAARTRVFIHSCDHDVSYLFHICLRPYLHFDKNVNSFRGKPEGIANTPFFSPPSISPRPTFLILSL